MDVPYISPRLNTAARPDLEDRGLIETAEFYLATPFKNCETTSRDFGLIVKRPNYFQKPVPRLLCHNHESMEGLDLDDREVAIDRNKQYVISEILLCIDPHEMTTMMSHEGELFEAVEVIGPSGLIYRTAPRPRTNSTGQPFERGESFFAVKPRFGYKPSQNPTEESFEGFYHRLENPNGITNLSHIVLLAEKEMAMKDGKLMKFGISRPPNTWIE